MILAEKIIEERKKNGWSQEELADKLGVSRQAISKWESAGSVPDLQRIIRMSELFGVSTDYLLKDELTPEETANLYNEESGSEKPLHRVSMEEANSYLDSKRKSAPKIANATSLCILSPILLVVLGSMAEDGVYHISEALAATLGSIFMFGLIAIAVFTFITTGIKGKSNVHLEKNCFETEYGVTGMVKERRSAFEPGFARGIAVGVILCIVSVIPAIIAGAMEAPDYICGIFVAAMLTIIAIGVNGIIRAGIMKNAYDALLQEGEFTKEEKNTNLKLDEVSGAYWAVACAVYLAWSFISNRWDITWVVWPVAGVLFGVVKKFAKLIAESKK